MRHSTAKQLRSDGVVGVGDMLVVREQGNLVTHALGSCLGLIVHDPIARVGGLLHAMLPLSRLNLEKAASNPAMFVDTGVTALLEEIYAAGARKNQLAVRVAGCGMPLDAGKVFSIGDRNLKVVLHLLERNKIRPLSVDVGGTLSRTIRIDIASGEYLLRTNREVSRQ